jgi:hypothetical protein
LRDVRRSKTSAREVRWHIEDTDFSERSQDAISCYSVDRITLWRDQRWASDDPAIDRKRYIENDPQVAALTDGRRPRRIDLIEDGGDLRPGRLGRAALSLLTGRRARAGRGGGSGRARQSIQI